MPTASARSCSSVMVLIVSRMIDSIVSENRMASGIDAQMITVECHAAEEQQDHHAGERGGDEDFAKHAAHRRFDEYRLIADRLQVQRRQRLLDQRQPANAADHIQRRKRSRP